MSKIGAIVFIYLTLIMSLFTHKVVYAESIIIENAYVRETIPGTNISSAYMVITNKSGKAVTLVGASSKISPRIEIHQHIMQKGQNAMMQMRKKESLQISANETVILQPSGLHLMIFEVNEPLKDQQSVTMTLHFLNHKNINIQLAVKSIKRKQVQHHH